MFGTVGEYSGNATFLLHMYNARNESE